MRPGDRPSALPWDGMMAFGLGVLRLSPAAFWSMTLCELERAASGVLGREALAPLTKSELAALLDRHPDREKS